MVFILQVPRPSLPYEIYFIFIITVCELLSNPGTVEVRGHFSVSQSEFFMKTQSLTDEFKQYKFCKKQQQQPKNQRTKTNENSESQKAATLLKL